MSALSIEPTYPTFTDSDGSPLDDGYVWIGVAGSATPIANPQTAYWDAALTQVVTQPVRTRGGYPLNAGAVGRLYVNGDYSILVRNRNGYDLYSAPNATERISSELVTFLQAGTGAVPRTAQSKMRDVVSVFDFMTAAQIADVQAGTALVDVTAAIVAAEAALPAAGGEIYFPNGTYLHNSAITFTKNVRLVGNGMLHVNGVSPSELLKGSGITTFGIKFSGNGSSAESIAFRGKAGNTGDGVLIAASRVTLSNVAVYDMGNDGIRIGTDAGGENCNLWYLSNVRSKNNGRDGVRISEGAGGSADANGGTFVHGDLQDNASCGLYLGNCQLNNFFGVTSQTNGTYGIYLSGDVSNCVLVGGDWEGNVTSQLYVAIGAFPNYIQNMTVTKANVTLAETFNKVDLVDFTSIINGIQFPAVQIPSTDPNTLDDYEEGTWTPSLVPGTSGSITLTSPTNSMAYTKIGNVVTVTGQIVVSSVSSPVGDLRLEGLPFISRNTNAGNSGLNVFVASFLTVPTYTAVQAFVLQGTNSARIRGLNAGAQVTTMAANVQPGTAIVISGQYVV